MKYRFKTQDEFKRDGQWEDDNHCPLGWSLTGEMNHYLGQDVPEGFNENCDLREGFDDDGWWFESTNYVLKEEDYTGKYIKAIVDNPSCTGVRLGEVIKIISKPGVYILDRTARGISGMGIPHPLQTSEWELVKDPKDNYDDILEKARKLYPIGTAFISNLGSFDGVIQTVKAELNWYNENKDSISHPGIGWVYFDGKWAEIVKPATKQEYDAQFVDKKDPLYICKQEYRKGMKVRSAAKAGCYSGEFIIDVEPSEFRNLSGNTEVVDYSFSNGYLYFNGEYAEILEEGIYDVSEIIKTNKPSVDDYLVNSGFAKSNPEAYNWLMKPSIETVHSVDVNLRTKKQINKFKF